MVMKKQLSIENSGMKKNIVFLLCLIALSAFPSFVAAQKRVTGTVKDNTGSPLSGVSVVVKNTTNGTTTNSEGRFSISAPVNSTLELSFTGYETKEIPVNNQSTIDAILQLKNNSLNEVVVVGYGTQKR
jgi:hypothetical protein